MAACNLGLELYEEALETCNQILKQDPQHLKALYRKAKAYLELFEYEKSIQIFELLKKQDDVNRVTELQLLSDETFEWF